MLNLVTSISADTFFLILVDVKQIDYKVLIETVYEVKALLFWRKSNGYGTSVNMLLAAMKKSQLFNQRILLGKRSYNY